ncbi:MAG: FliM/FliN family flagellar motor switch protein [candidate division FCPU426 bacterium]
MAKTKSNGDKNGKTPENAPELPVGVRRYDFRVARKLSGSQRMWLGALHSRLAAVMTKQLGERFRCECDCAFLGLEQIQGASFPLPDTGPVVTAEISLPTGTTRMYFLWPREMMFFFLERLLGGSGDELFLDKELSEFEQSVLRHLCQEVAQWLHAASEAGRIPAGSCNSVREGQDSFAELLPYEILLTASLNLKLGTRQGKLLFIYPYALVKSWVDETAPSPETAVPEAPPAPTDPAAAGLVPGLAQAPLPVQVRLGQTRIKVGDFVNLAVGDCVQLNHSIQEPCEVYIGEKPKFKGHLGLIGRQLGVKLTGSIEANTTTTH